MTGEKSSTFSSFARDVSVVGLRYAFLGSASRFRRTIWFFLVLSGFVFTTYQIQDKVRFLLSYPTVVNIGIKHTKTLKFPTVTICNENWMTKSSAERLGVAELAYLMFPPIPVGPAFQPNFTGYEEMFSPNNTYDWEHGFREWAQPKEQAIEECIWKSEYCNHTWFQTVPTNMGYCFQFNSKNQSLYATREGASYGLELILFVNQSDYWVTHSMSAGFRVLLHAPDETPLMKEWGFKVSPGFHTLVSTTLTKVIQLEPPWGDCSDAEGYTYSDCTSHCEADYVIRNCSCKEFYMPGDARVCNPQEMHECVVPSMNAYVTNDLQSQCACPHQCLKNNYRYTISQAVGSRHAMTFIAEKVLNRSDTEETLHDYCVLTIFFSQLSHEEIRTRKRYDVMSLFCDIGGALGLILGSTLLTLCELGDFCIVQMWDKLYLGKKKKTPVKFKSNEPSV